MGGSSTQPTQTSTPIFTPEQRQLQQLAMPYAKDFAANPPKLPDQSFIPPFDPLQTQGQNMALDASGTQQNLVSSGADASQFLTSGAVLSPDSNPALKASIDAGVAPIYDNLLERVLPGVRSGAAGSGNFGGSRQAIAESLAIKDANRAAGEVSSKMANQGYQTGLDAFTKGLALLPQTTASQLTPSLTTSGVGDVRQNLMRELLGEQAGRFNYESIAPFLMAEKLFGLSSSMPTGVTSTANVAQPNTATSALGGAAAGASLGSLLGPVGTAGGAAIGGLLPFLMR